MMNVPPAAERLIARYQLGQPIQVYRPNTALSVIVGLFVIAFAVAWTLIVASITNSSLIPFRLFSSTMPGSTDMTGTVNSVFNILGIIFPLFGVIFLIIGLGVITSAILNSRIRAFVCNNGVAYLMRNGADAFRWEQVLKVFHKVTSSTSTSTNQQGFTTTSTRLSHTYTVHCHDGRKFVFNSTLGKVQDLAETIEVQAARAAHASEQRFMGETEY